MRSPPSPTRRWSATSPSQRAPRARSLHAHVAEPPPRPSERVRDLPSQVDDVIVRGLAKSPAERPASASDLMQDLHDALPPPPPLRRPRPAIAPGGPPTPDPGDATEPPAPAPAGSELAGDSTSSADRWAHPPRRDPRRGVKPAPQQHDAGPVGGHPAAPGVSVVEPPPEQEARERGGATRGRRAWFAIAAAVIVVGVAATAGALVGGGEEPTPPQARTFSGGPVSVRAPGSWRATSPPAVPGLSLAGDPRGHASSGR